MKRRLVSMCLAVMLVGGLSLSSMQEVRAAGNKVIDGIQGRYYIPILFIFPFLFNNLSIKINEKKELNLFNKYILLFIVSYNVYALLSILYIYI